MSAVLTANTLYYLTVVPESSDSAHFVVRRIQIN
jgi:hypothetical protein